MQRLLALLAILVVAMTSPLAAQSVTRPFTLGISAGPTMVTGEDRSTRAFAEIAVHNVFGEGGSARLYPVTVGFTF